MTLLTKADSKNKKPARGFEYIPARIKFEMKARAVSDKLTFDLGKEPLQWVALSSDLTDYPQVPVTFPTLVGTVKPDDAI